MERETVEEEKEEKEEDLRRCCVVFVEINEELRLHLLIGERELERLSRKNKHPKTSQKSFRSRKCAASISFLFIHFNKPINEAFMQFLVKSFQFPFRFRKGKSNTIPITI